MAKEPSGRGTRPNRKKISRREFLGAGGVATLAATGLVTGMGESSSQAATSEGIKYGMTIDLERCFGCQACIMACKVENNTPMAVFWMYVFRFEEGRYPRVRMQYLPRPCMHCDNAPCVKVCPVGARYKREDGIVATDVERCIGCRYCAVSCPYSVNYYNWKDSDKSQYLDWTTPEELLQVTGGAIPPYENPDHEALYGREMRLISGGSHQKGVMGKCTFCVHRVEKGLLPACVANCPATVYHFGNLNDPESDVSRALRKKRFFRLAEEIGTQPRVYYLGAPPPGLEFRKIQAMEGRV